MRAPMSKTAGYRFLTSEELEERKLTVISQDQQRKETDEIKQRLGAIEKWMDAKLGTHLAKVS